MKPKTQRGKTPTRGRFAPLAQVPPLAFLVSFSFQFTFNLNYGAKLIRGGLLLRTGPEQVWVGGGYYYKLRVTSRGPLHGFMWFAVY